MEEDEVDLEELSEEEARRTIHALTELLESPGWAILKRFAEGQENERIGQVMLKATTSDAVYEQEYMKGEFQGIKTLMAFPKILLDNTKAELEEILRTLAAENGEDGTSN